MPPNWIATLQLGSHFDYFSLTIHVTFHKVDLQIRVMSCNLGHQLNLRTGDNSGKNCLCYLRNSLALF